MSDEDALIAAIIANPDEDTPRLIYADWLHENGDGARAEFIRLQIELARPHGSDQPAASLRETELLVQHRGDWLRQLSNKLNGAHYHFRRGFPECVETDAAQLANLDAGFSFDPLIREAIARGADSSICTLGRRPISSKVRLRAWFADASETDPVLIDLLQESPASREPYLSRGRWLILCWSVWSGYDRITVHRLVTHHRTRKLPVQVAIRPFNDHGEFATWCLAHEQHRCPIWLALDNGELVDEVVGLEPPEEFREGWPMT